MKYRRLDYDAAKALLTEEFSCVEMCYKDNMPPEVSENLKQSVRLMFASSTQSIREVALGLAIARTLDPEIDIRSPYTTQGGNSFSGRSLDERVVNPFLIDRRIPCSRGPYLAVFRRSIRFVEETKEGVKDAEAYEALLRFIEELEEASQPEALSLLRYLLYSFVHLREQSAVQLIRLKRISLEQYGRLIDSLCRSQSGGLIPVLLTVALLETLKEVYRLNWRIEWQGINVADRPKGVPGDITVFEGDDVHIAFEITERQIDEARLDAVFQAKISPSAVEDYLFMYTNTNPTDNAQQMARQLFVQGHDIGFLRIRAWIINNLATIGTQGRAVFNKAFLNLLEDAPAMIKMVWNDLVRDLVSI